MTTDSPPRGTWSRARVSRALLVLATLLLVVSSGCSDSRREPIAEPLAERAPTAAPGARGTFATAPASLKQAHLRAVQQDAPASYAFTQASPGAPARAENARHGLRAELDREGAVRIHARVDAALTLVAVGRPTVMRAAPAVSRGPEITRSRASFARGAGIEEWYVNGPLGLEQGFVIAEPPSAEPSALVLDVRVSGARPVAGSRAGEIALLDDAGEVAFKYSGLAAMDADGRDLPSAMRAEGRSILLSVDDRGARYPITIDPIVWVEDDKLLQAATGTVSDQLGASLSLSGDTAILGAAGSDDEGVDAGAAYVFVKSGAAWVQQQKITAMDAQPGAHFGCSVAISGDVALIGAYGDDEKGTDAGAAYVFVRSGNTWTQTKKIVLAAGHADDYLGYAVAIAGDTALVGAHGDDAKGSMAGAAYVFAKDEGGAGNWGEVAALTGSDGAAQDNFGVAVAIAERHRAHRRARRRRPRLALRIGVRLREERRHLDRAAEAHRERRRGARLLRRERRAQRQHGRDRRAPRQPHRGRRGRRLRLRAQRHHLDRAAEAGRLRPRRAGLLRRLGGPLRQPPRGGRLGRRREGRRRGRGLRLPAQRRHLDVAEEDPRERRRRRRQLRLGRRARRHGRADLRARRRQSRVERGLGVHARQGSGRRRHLG
ncbi:MAG: hypothetical protein V9G14_17800 [Cypionkella sp.]